MLAAEAFDHLVNRHLVALGTVLQNLGSRRCRLLHLQTAQKPDVIDHSLVAGISRRDVNRAVADLERQNAVAPYEIGGEGAKGLRRHVEFGKTLKPSFRTRPLMTKSPF